eukprot:2421275-Rhodomonas_salina.2
MSVHCDLPGYAKGGRILVRGPARILSGTDRNRRQETAFLVQMQKSRFLVSDLSYRVPGSDPTDNRHTLRSQPQPSSTAQAPSVPGIA